jgi:hypothetical protein
MMKNVEVDVVGRDGVWSKAVISRISAGKWKLIHGDGGEIVRFPKQCVEMELGNRSTSDRGGKESECVVVVGER